MGVPELSDESPARWWRKFVSDLSSTRIQLTYLVAGLFAYATIKGIGLVRDVPGAVAMVGVLIGPFLGVLTYHLTGKWMEARQNGNGRGATP